MNPVMATQPDPEVPLGQITVGDHTHRWVRRYNEDEFYPCECGQGYREWWDSPPVKDRE